MTKRPAIWFILATILIDAIGVGLIFPMMPDLLARVGAPDTGTAALWGGVLMAAYALMQFLFAPAVGGLSDMLGRKPVLLAALLALALDYVLMALAGTFWLLLLGRVVAGIAGATYITATAYLSDISKPEERAANFGLIGAVYGIGFVLGPALGGLLAGLDIALPFWVAAGLSAGNVLFGLAVLPESLPEENRRRFTRTDLNPFSAILAAARLPGLALPLACLFVFEFANMVYPTLWAFWGREAFGWSAAVIGASLAAYGIGVTITQAGIMRLLIPRIGDRGTLMVAVVAGILAAAAFGVIDAGWMVFALLPVACLADMAPPTATAIAANMVDERRQGVLQGVIASLGSIAAVLAPLVMTPIFRAFTAPEAPVYLPGAPFLLTAALLLFMSPAFLAMGRARRPGPPAGADPAG